MRVQAVKTPEPLPHLAYQGFLFALDYAPRLSPPSGHRRRTTERLGIGMRTLYEKLERYGLE
jgi:hypothetical protein